MVKKFRIFVFFLVFCKICIAGEFGYLWASYTTYFKENIDDRMVNIKNAVRYLDGYVLLPKTIFSFNEDVTSKIPEDQFAQAPILVGEKRVPGFGGGLCQVASTLYAASLYAGLSIHQRKPHSKLVSYILPGLDATVSKEEGIDLEIYNPYICPVMIKAVNEANSLTISIYSTKPKFRQIKISITEPKKIDNFVFTTTTRQVYSKGKLLFSEIVSRDKYLDVE